MIRILPRVDEALLEHGPPEPLALGVLTVATSSNLAPCMGSFVLFFVVTFVTWT